MTPFRRELRPHATPAHIALIGTFPPRRCGIATFTEDCRVSLEQGYPEMQIDCFAIDDGSDALAYAPDVHRIAEDDRIAYAAAAQQIGNSGAELIWLQHEFGIFGGPAGEHILHLLDRTSLPLVVTLHTVLEQPDPAQLRVMQALIARASQLIVMARHASDILERRYGVSRDRIGIVPHGVPSRPFVEPDTMKPRFGLEGRKVILTFGLLAPDKGIDTMIGAMPAIVARHPDALYIVLGATHPCLRRREGEALRERLQAQAASLGVADNVRFIDHYVELPELLDRLQAADLYVTPYNNPAQVTSGTLSYAVGMGKPVISTPYVHARELLAEEMGVLTAFGDSAAMAQAVIALLDDEHLRNRHAARAYDHGRDMVWEQCAHRFADILGSARAAPNATPRRAVARTGTLVPDMTAVIRMSDNTGILQHGRFSIPDRRHGYCLDDNARALMLVARIETMDPQERQRWTSVYGAFVEHAWNEDARKFRNFMRYDRSWAEEVGSDDSFGRAIWSLGITARDHPDAQYCDWAADLLRHCLPAAASLQSPRAHALTMLGAAALLEARGSQPVAVQLLESFGEDLLALLTASRRPDWAWFEVVLAYDNARLPEALLRAGKVLSRPDFIACGLETLTWIADRQTADEGHFRAVGTESFGRPYCDPLPYDQQPLEAQATIDACMAALDATGDDVWRTHARTAYDWFLGANDVGLALASGKDGGCYDGLMPQGVNRNQGAESILALQLSSCAMVRLERSASVGSQRNLLPQRNVSASIRYH